MDARNFSELDRLKEQNLRSVKDRDLYLFLAVP